MTSENSSPASLKSSLAKKSILLDPYSVPKHVINLKETLPSLSPQVQLESLKRCLCYVLEPFKLSKLEQSEQQDATVIPGLLELIKLIFKLPPTVKTEHILSDLTQLGLDTACIALLSSEREKILQEKPVFPRMGLEHSELSWRLDVSLSSGYVSKIVEPTISMLLPSPHSSSDAPDNIPVEMSVPVFHSLRSNVARALYQMQHKCT